MKSSSLASRNHLSEILGNHLGLKSYLSDPDFLFRATIDKEDIKYYSYILVYVNDTLIVDKYSQKYIDIRQKTVYPQTWEHCQA